MTLRLALASLALIASSAFAENDIKPGPAIYEPGGAVFQVCQVLTVNGLNAKVVISETGRQTTVACSKLSQSR